VATTRAGPPRRPPAPGLRGDPQLRPGRTAPRRRPGQATPPGPRRRHGQASRC